MKKLITPFLSFCLLLGLTSCEKSDEILIQPTEITKEANYNETLDAKTTMKNSGRVMAPEVMANGQEKSDISNNMNEGREKDTRGFGDAPPPKSTMEGEKTSTSINQELE